MDIVELLKKNGAKSYKNKLGMKDLINRRLSRGVLKRSKTSEGIKLSHNFRNSK